jgi:ABC-2 type transporter
MLPPESKTKTLRWFILRTLLKKEISRHLANRGGLILAGLLIVVALLSSQFGQNTKGIDSGNLTANVHNCFVDYWQKDAWVEHLEENVPDELRSSLRFRQVPRAMADHEQLVYPPGTGAIQIRPNGAEAGQSRYLIWFWQPSGDENGLAPFESWFWKESYAYFQEQAAPILAESGDLATQAPILEQRRTALSGGLDAKTGITTALVLFAVFFVCVYLLPSLTCEERERGVLVAQALSPATAREILAAKFLFYPIVGMALASLLAGLNQPSVLRQPFFWFALTVSACGSLGVGMSIASLAKTQRAASMGALCYMMVVTLFVFVCQQTNVPYVPYLALEYHCPRMLHAALTGTIAWFHWAHLLCAWVLSVFWAILATSLFRRYGWQ